MKTFFIAALAALTIGGSAFAADKTAADASKLNSLVKVSFEKQFQEAENVSWTVRNSFIKASFTMLGQQVEAFFGEEGELIGTSRKIEFEKLPLLTVTKIRKDYAGYTVSEAIEFTREDDTNYYVSLSKGDKKQVLQVTPYGSVSVYRSARQ
ncbi:hypothetical protein [Sediminibacterium soli]|uniref:hypothetical protein n=1 Tax=Sediminibacterium soli TaxID=2698829 RepID=UPI00137A738F|nr:hypothetical protein [Sediminibacterium soli]NCI47686.1 hypothetical protein [Sediminibacterium soli]